jgi:hypothetical protein
LLHWDALSNRSFVSPISQNALSYYKYKLIGSFDENGMLMAFTQCRFKIIKNSQYLFCRYIAAYAAVYSG